MRNLIARAITAPHPGAEQTGNTLKDLGVGSLHEGASPTDERMAHCAIEGLRRHWSHILDILQCANVPPVICYVHDPIVIGFFHTTRYTDLISLTKPK